MKKLVSEILQKAIKKEFDLKFEKEKIEPLLENPPNTEMGDFAFPCFALAKELKSNPSDIALQLREAIGTEPATEFDDIQTAGPYVNFFVNRKSFALKLISKVKKQGDKFGSSKIGKEKIMIEFSQPNTHKAFHIGHVRGTSLGESLARINEFVGNKVIRANYSGDTGMHIAKWLWCYQNYHSREKLKPDEDWIASIYVDAVKRLAKNEKLQKKVDEINLKLGTREDKELNVLWKKTKNLSIESWKKIYEQLNTKFDVHYFESEMEGDGLRIVDNLLKNKIAKVSDGAVIIDLKKYDLGVWVLLRKDRTVLYSTKDIALAEKKFKEHESTKSLVVVGDEQDLHFKQLEKTLKLMNFPQADYYSHLPFAMVRLPQGKMSSRTGDNILYSDFIKELVEIAKKRIKERDSKIKPNELEKRALSISVAALKFAMLKQSTNKRVIFNPKESVSFEGNTGPYLLYGYARASSILRKIKKQPKAKQLKELDEKEYNLVNKIAQFPKVVEKSYSQLNPSLIANYSYELAQIFNEFYQQCPVINSENEKFRIDLVDAFRQTLKNSLSLLGIDTLEKM